jgi:hypothetical protein
VARHNREGTGSDQRGFEYRISYQPDWLRRVKVTRALPNGRQSTKTLFRNPTPHREMEVGGRVRTRVTCEAQGVDVELVMNGSHDGLRRVSITVAVPRAGGRGVEEVTLTLEDGLRPARKAR